jgi:histidinol phosphatase-like PHP family hydrolase
MRKIDLHIHTTHSDSTLTVAEVARKARRSRVTAGICDHLSPYHKMFEPGAFDDYVEDVRGYDLLLGAEYCIGEEIPVGPERLARLDYLLGGLHAVVVGGKRCFFWGAWYPEDPADFVSAYTETTLAALAADPMDVLAHPTYLPNRFADLYEEMWDEERTRSLWTAAADRGIAVEISGRWMVPRPPQIKLAFDMGLNFAIGSDAHRRDELFELEYPLQMVELFGIPESRIFRPERHPG